MSTFVLVPGAGGDASYWSELTPELQRRGHDAVAVDIVEDDPALGLPEYADIVDAAIGDRTGVVLVAQSLGGFTAAVTAQRHDLARLVFVNAMIPLPRERPGEWWDATGSSAARAAAAGAGGYSVDFDVETYFLHDVPPDVLGRLAQYPPPRVPADTPFGQPCEFTQWPRIPVRVVIGRDDRFFPPRFQREVARARLGADVVIEEIDGGHLVALSNAAGLAQVLTRDA
jgi:pimeloyl-ACP methyl ester carboxylesterase